MKAFLKISIVGILISLSFSSLSGTDEKADLKQKKENSSNMVIGKQTDKEICKEFYLKNSDFIDGKLGVLKKYADLSGAEFENKKEDYLKFLMNVNGDNKISYGYLQSTLRSYDQAHRRRPREGELWLAEMCSVSMYPKTEDRFKCHLMKTPTLKKFRKEISFQPRTGQSKLENFIERCLVVRESSNWSVVESLGITDQAEGISSSQFILRFLYQKKKSEYFEFDTIID